MEATATLELSLNGLLDDPLMLYFVPVLLQPIVDTENQNLDRQPPPLTAPPAFDGFTTKDAPKKQPCPAIRSELRRGDDEILAL